MTEGMSATMTGMSAIMAAAAEGDNDAISELVEQGLQVDAPDDVRSHTPSARPPLPACALKSSHPRSTVRIELGFGSVTESGAAPCLCRAAIQPS